MIDLVTNISSTTAQWQSILTSRLNVLLPRNISQEFTKTKADLKVAYNPDEIVQVFYKKLQNSKLTLAALGDPVNDVELMQCAFELFEVHTDLKDACRDWDWQLAAPTWAQMMVHFIVEIKRNQTDPSKIKIED